MHSLPTPAPSQSSPSPIPVPLQSRHIPPQFRFNSAPSRPSAVFPAACRPCPASLARCVLLLVPS
ncbi:hypothetical protein E2C01_058148 [Portunus trituberculatus]|uniref:Uncharacterized protein n=1 Tax=Portunus trituberculatus TaxID=210409 RepID=A0A5B7H4I7_PORTR|nr:hypothetical protein [Portunus trituberculatus]